jgi:hypothetical protein
MQGRGLKYPTVCLCVMQVVKYQIGTSTSVSRTWHFLTNHDNKAEVNHIDGNKLNNHIDNLEWVTQQKTTQHAWDIGLCDE